MFAALLTALLALVVLTLFATRWRPSELRPSRRRGLAALAIALAILAPLLIHATAQADERTVVTATLPLANVTSTSSVSQDVSSAGLGISYDVVHIRLSHGSDLVSFGLAPAVIAENVAQYTADKFSWNSVNEIHVTGGLFCTFSVWHLSAGIGEVLRPGGGPLLTVGRWAPTVYAGWRL